MLRTEARGHSPKRTQPPAPREASGPRPEPRITTADAATCAALALLLVSSYVLNAYLFPSVAGIFPAGREISTYCGVVFSLVVAGAAYRRPSLLREGAWSAACLVLFAAGLALLYAGIVTENPLLVGLGSPFGGMGSVWFSVLVGIALIKLGPTRCAIAIPTAFMAKYAVQLALASFGSVLPLLAALVLYFLCMALAYALTKPWVRGLMATIRASASPTVLDVTNPSSFLPFSSLVYVSIFLFNAACGYAFASQRATFSAPATLLSFAPVIVVFFVVVARARLSADTLYRASTLLVFAGFLAAPLALMSADGSADLHTSSVLLYAGADCFSVLTYFLVAAVGARNPLGALATSAFAVAAGWLGIAGGALAAQVAEGLAAHDPSPMLGALALITFLFMAYNFVVLKNFSFEDAIRGIRPVPRELSGAMVENAGPAAAEGIDDGFLANKFGGGAPAEEEPERSAEHGIAEAENGVETGASSDFERCCATVVDRFGLTPRESDVLRLLARGRTSPVIQEKLFLSHNTVKTHVRHIYAKMDIHSQQELIDIVERSEES